MAQILYWSDGVTFGKGFRLELIYYIFQVFFKETLYNPYRNTIWYGSFKIAAIFDSREEIAAYS